MKQPLPIIRLPAGITDSLGWAYGDVPSGIEGNGILWELDLGLSQPQFPLDDPLRFEALALAADLFTRELWPRQQKESAGVILYRGPLDVTERFLWTQKQEENWHEWVRHYPQGSQRWNAHLRRLFALESYIAYFQLFAHRLPDELPIFLFFQSEPQITAAYRAHLLSKERMGHFLHLAVEEVGTVAICVPEEALCQESVLDQIDRLYVELQETKGPIRFVSEAFLTEEWDGLDEIYVMSAAVSPRGRRKLMGFQATGARVVEVDSFFSS